ncbi:MAG: hypothetical protein M3R00_01830 [Pseudomonadota bacterium]|nr:hypothetical protein [Pseudomonadota bacterium]
MAKELRDLHSPLKTQVLEALRNPDLNGGDNLLEIINDIHDIDSTAPDAELRIIEQLCKCYAIFRPIRKSSELQKEHSIPNTIRDILHDEFGVDRKTLEASKGTTTTLFNLLKKAHNTFRRTHQPDANKIEVSPLRLAMAKVSANEHMLYHSGSIERYDSGVEKPKPKSSMLLHFLNLAASSYASARSPRGDINALHASRAISLEFDKRNPSFVYTMKSNSKGDYQFESTNEYRQVNQQLGQFPMYQIYNGDKPTNVLFPSQEQAQIFINAAKMHPEALQDNAWDLAAIHPEPIDTSIKILNELIKTTKPKSSDPFQDVAVAMVQDLVERAQLQQDSSLFKDDINETVGEIENFLSMNKISEDRFLTGLKAAQIQCVERLEVKADQPSPQQTRLEQ